MIHTELNGCRISILPVIKGLRSEYDRVKSQIDDSYDCVAVTLSIEDIELFSNMPEDVEYDPSDFDAVYAHFLKQFGAVDVPVPAFKAVVDAWRMGPNPYHWRCVTRNSQPPIAIASRSGTCSRKDVF